MADARSKHPLLSVLVRLCVLIVITVGIAALFNATSSAGISWSGTEAFAVEVKAEEAGMALVSLEQMQAILEEGDYIILDARSAQDFEKGHIPGALSMPLGSAAQVFEELQILLTPDQPVLAYCSGKSCDSSLRLGEFLREQGVKQVALFEGGMEQWRAANLEIETGQ